MAEYNDDIDPSEARKGTYRDKYKKYNNVPDLAHQMKHVQEIKETAEKELKEINAEYDVLRLEVIPAKCEEQGIEGIKIEGLGRLNLTADLYVSIKAGMKKPLFDWFSKAKLRDMVQPTVNSSTLKAFVKGRIKAGKPLPEEFLNVTPFTRASITKE